MRQTIIDHLDAGGSGLDPVAREAIGKLKWSVGRPRAVTKATEFNRATDHGADRDLLSDAD